MRQISSMLQGLARSMSLGKERKVEEEHQGTVMRLSGTLWGKGSETFAAACSRRGEKGTNQDTSIVSEAIHSPDYVLPLGTILDHVAHKFLGYGACLLRIRVPGRRHLLRHLRLARPVGPLRPKAVRESLPQSLLCRWQEAVTLASLIDGEKRLIDCQFDLVRKSYLAAAAAVDEELRRSRRLDAINNGCTALSIMKQSDLMVVANVSDSRAVLATTSDDGDITTVQLTVDFKPDLPQEKARILQCEGRVHCLNDNPGVHRVWVPHREAPGLAMSRAFGDYCVKDYGVILVPEVTWRRITAQDQFVILATDGSDLMVVANVSDSRAILATMSDDGDITTVQLTVDFKPDLP
ncbi:hypothetical protein CFC21_104758 [Triticum aestivum]|uniref:protein-serine/threonine phosphatase n=2 Tax=Triticum aestivum TaxID=4565 RepID=A0A3B6SS87_WHEAT|nr:hypothetical protein CFC21_104758 [Triticum aestivum]